MRSRGNSPSKKFVSAVVGFVSGSRLFGQPRESTLSLMLESFRLRRQTKELNKKYNIDEKDSKWTR
jgi:hypothetical protein